MSTSALTSVAVSPALHSQSIEPNNTLAASLTLPPGSAVAAKKATESAMPTFTFGVPTYTSRSARSVPTTLSPVPGVSPHVANPLTGLATLAPAGPLAGTPAKVAATGSLLSKTTLGSPAVLSPSHARVPAMVAATTSLKEAPAKKALEAFSKSVTLCPDAELPSLAYVREQMVVAYALAQGCPVPDIQNVLMTECRLILAAAFSTNLDMQLAARRTFHQMFIEKGGNRENAQSRV